MIRRVLPAILMLGIAASAISAGRPNIALFIADDLTFRDIGCYGGQARTPAIDGLATEGLQFTRCFQAAPTCSPTRHCLYTGMYPVKTGAYPNHTFVSRPRTISIAQRLKSLGYRVALAGKTHIAPKKVFPFEYLSDPIDIAQTQDFMSSCTASRTPFCIIFASHHPHGPWEGGKPGLFPPDTLKLFPTWFDTSETRTDYQAYLAELSLFDDEVAGGLKAIDAAGATSSTLVMVLSEQGTAQPGAKWNLYDQGIQSACIVRWPGVVKPGRVTDAMVEYVDVVPTFVEVAGGKLTPDLDGKSFLGVLSGKTDRHKDYVYAVSTMRGITNGSDHYGIRSVRSATHKLIWNFTPGEPFKNGSVNGRTFRSWVARADAGDTEARKAVDRYLHRTEYELYDVVSDPFELTNLTADPALTKVKADLRIRLEQWMKQQGDRGQATEMAAYEHQTAKRRASFTVETSDDGTTKLVKKKRPARKARAENRRTRQ